MFGVVANCAGVVENQIRFFGFFSPSKAHGVEDAGHPLGVGLVHLTAEGGDVVAAGLVAHGSGGAIETLYSKAGCFDSTVVSIVFGLMVLKKRTIIDS